ncbi:RNA polymerase Rpb5 [Methanocaldococcus vulcanius M7]|uniref:DNA-directed RNA polymerase subunit Rpo5 n=1 Tax=Methanocaldococcus vulcanius (strain ATCC 700851 / DSM 12094 / M7) TaxID=579137 RepID=C9RDL1_METVM|nr:RNA polymerase Rpb5 [Methanocaldococcus vulcanius M7]
MDGGIILKVTNHILVPKHEIVPKEEVDEILKKYNIKIQQLPKIYEDDPVIQEIGAKEGDVIKITRNSPTAGLSIAYRLVIKRIV